MLMALQLVECIRPILPSIRNTPYGKRIQSKLAREDASFSNYGGGSTGFAGRGGYRGAPGGVNAGSGGFHRHLGRPELQHLNALTEVYGSQGGFIPPGPAGYVMQSPAPSAMAPTHTGVSYHAPGPDGQPWLHLRGPAGTSAQNWGASPSGQDTHSSAAPSQDGHLPDPTTMWQDPPHHFMPFAGAHGHGPGHGHPAHVQTHAMM